MDIPLIEPVVGDEELDRIEAVIESGYLTQGPVASEFENRFAQVTDANHAVTTTSCTTGMELALRAIGIGPGDEVVVPNFTYPATALSVNRVGATPVLVDVDPLTFNISIEQIRGAITEDTAALLPVSWGGQPLDPDPIRELAATHDLAVIEDAACSVGAAFEDEPVGSQFDASVFSLHPRKVITTGEGGVVTTDDDGLERELRSLKNFGTDPSGDHDGFRRPDATNYRMSDLLAAIGVSQLDKLDEIIGARRRLASRYDDLLADVEKVRTPHVPTEAEHVFQSYCVYIEAGDETLRDQLMDALASAGIETQIGTYAVHRTDAFADAKRTGSLETSSALYDNLLTLPMAHSMDDDQQRWVVDTLRSELASRTSTA